MEGLIRRFWVPVWDLPPGAVSTQRVLQYPVCQVVIAPDYALVVGPRRGMSIKVLAGQGWAMGAMLQPATGSRLLGRSMNEVVGRDLGLADLPTIRGGDLIVDVRQLLEADPSAGAAQQEAARAVESTLSALLPVDEGDLVVNAIVDYVENAPEVERVSQICDKFAVSERSLQRLMAKRVGLSPRWLIKRRRLHEAAGRLAKRDHPPMAQLAMELGYADQAHFHRDFRAVTGLTPTQYAAEPRGQRGR